MITIIAGSRTIKDYSVLENAIAHIDWSITSVISGTATGADKLGEKYAREKGIPLHKMPAAWKKHGKRAGYLRNIEMAENAQACIVLWDGRSKGAKMMIEIARQYKLALLICSLILGQWIIALFPVGKQA